MPPLRRAGTGIRTSGSCICLRLAGHLRLFGNNFLIPSLHQRELLPVVMAYTIMMTAHGDVLLWYPWTRLRISPPSNNKSLISFSIEYLRLLRTMQLTMYTTSRASTIGCGVAQFDTWFFSQQSSNDPKSRLRHQRPVLSAKFTAN
jgi:hypothetical protein